MTGPGGCGNCHSPLGPDGFIKGKELAGRLVEKNDAFTAIAPNITPGGVIADWTDAEVARSIREGGNGRYDPVIPGALRTAARFRR